MQLRPTGYCAQVSAFSPTPEEGIQSIQILPQDSISDSQLAPEDVLISVRSAGLSWVDILMTSALYQHRPELPFTPGLEYSGVILAVGEAVDKPGLKPGSEVFTDCLGTGPRTRGKYGRFGGCASYAIAPQSAVHPKPARLSFDQACNLAGTYETAYHCLVAVGGLKAGETVLIHGASGSTGLAAVHLAKALGATVIATGRCAQKLAVVESQGADHVLPLEFDTHTGTLLPFRSAVKAFTDGRGVDVVYDGVGGPISEESLRAMAFGGRFVVVGWASTPMVSRGAHGPQPNQLPTNLILMKGIQVLGAPMVIATQKDPSIRHERWSTILHFASTGAITPHVSHTFPLDLIQDALWAKWRGEIVGGCAIHLPSLIHPDP